MQNICLLLTILCALSQAVFAAPSDPARPQAGLRNSSGSRRLGASQLRKVLDGLRHKTGFLEMRFDESGLLTLGDRARFVGGSATARELLIATVDGRVAIELESHDYSPHIAFAHITPGVIYASSRTKERIEVRQVRLDFSDFAELRGAREVIAAFDLGFAALHELAHGVLGLRDAVGETAQLGECDERINRMRRELNLPERRGYSPRIESVFEFSRTARRAELVFARERGQSGRARTERFYLYWDADRVASATQAKHSTL
jgi:hypothetical protein